MIWHVCNYMVSYHIYIHMSTIYFKKLGEESHSATGLFWFGLNRPAFPWPRPWWIRMILLGKRSAASCRSALRFCTNVWRVSPWKQYIWWVQSGPMKKSPSSKRFCEGLPEVKVLYLWAKNTAWNSKKPHWKFSTVWTKIPSVGKPPRDPGAEVFEALQGKCLIQAIFDGLVFKFFSGLTTENGGLTIQNGVVWPFKNGGLT